MLLTVKSLLRVCAWCDTAVTPKGVKYHKLFSDFLKEVYPLHQHTHTICSECKSTQDAMLADYKKSQAAAQAAADN